MKHQYQFSSIYTTKFYANPLWSIYSRVFCTIKSPVKSYTNSS